MFRATEGHPIGEVRGVACGEKKEDRIDSKRNKGERRKMIRDFQEILHCGMRLNCSCHLVRISVNASALNNTLRVDFVVRLEENVADWIC